MGGASGTGNGTVTFSAAANSGAARSGTIAIAGQSFTVDQAASCTASLNPMSQSIPVGGGAGAPIAVTSAAGCGWTAVSNAQWLTITSGASGAGNGTVSFTAAANSGAARSGTLTIAGQPFTANQAGCAGSINPTSQAFPMAASTSGPISVTIDPGCPWTATSNASWITIKSGATGPGSGTVTFTVAANDGPARSGTLTVAGQTFTATQATACNGSLNPVSRNVGKDGVNNSTVDLTIGSACGWTAVSQVNWITIQSGVSGTGNGQVKFNVDKLPGGQDSRTGTIVIAGLTFTVNESR
jgi:hypothetical protein